MPVCTARQVVTSDDKELAHGPLVETEVDPDHVDICLVEGAVSTEDDGHMIKLIRGRTGTLISFGDCALTADIPAMPNPIGVLDCVYLENLTLNPGALTDVPAALLPTAGPVQRVVKVDVFLPGCPPSADLSHHCPMDPLQEPIPDTRGARFGL